MRIPTTLNKIINIGLISLGCDKNRVDSEMILSKINEKNFSITNDMTLADYIIINTCAFIEPARKESIDTVFDVYANKKPSAKIIICGCLPKLSKEALFKNFSEADCIVAGDLNDVMKSISLLHNSKERLYVPFCKQDEVSEGSRILTTPSHYAYIKIADGCNNWCSYCTIPTIRGRFRSRSIEHITEEAMRLANLGVKELILVAQDVTKYGADLYNKPCLLNLLQELSKIDGIKWIRLLYCYPELVDEELLGEILSNDKIVKYIDIPLQHVDNDILHLMNRKNSEKNIYSLFDKLSSNYSDIAVRSTFICGFPTETNMQFEKISSFLMQYKLDNVGFFAYSKESITPSAKINPQVHYKTKQFRVKSLYGLQKNISWQKNKNRIGISYETLVDELLETNQNGYLYSGHTQFQAPSIDGITYIQTESKLQIGQFYQVKMIQCNEYDLYGEIL